MSNRNETIFSNFPIIETERLVLREIVEEDAEDLFGYYYDKEVTQYLDWDGPNSIEDAKGRIYNWNKGFNEKSLIRWGIALKSDNHLIGTVRCVTIYADFGDHGVHPCPPVEIGYELSRSQWRKGIMIEALKAIIPYLFEKIETSRIQADVFPENIASLKLLKKLGFLVEGHLRDYVYHMGTMRFNDVMILSFLKKDFMYDTGIYK